MTDPLIGCDSLLSHFTVSPDDKEILRIASAALIAPDGSGYEVESCRKQGGGPIVCGSLSVWNDRLLIEVTS